MIDKSLLYERIVQACAELTKQPMVCCGYEKLPFDDDPAVGFASIPAGAKYCVCRLASTTTDGSIQAYYRLDGVAPDADDGIPLAYMDLFDITGGTNIANFKIIADSAANLTLYVHYFK